MGEAIESLAEGFATGAHASVGQVRKYTGEPYITHPRAVACLVRSVPHTRSMVCAAWLHDVVEDTGVALGDVRSVFGDTVADLVEMLTDVSRPEDGNRATRKALDRAHIAKASPDAKTVKLADLIDNSRSIMAHDPSFARVYLAEKRLLLDVLTEGDPTLYAMARRIVDGNGESGDAGK